MLCFREIFDLHYYDNALFIFKTEYFMKTLIPAKRLSNISYSEKPLPQGGKAVLLSAEELESKMNFSYSESLDGDPKQLAEYLNSKALIKSIQDKQAYLGVPSAEAILERLNNPLDCLVICNMGPEVDCGLFAGADIPRGTVLFLYAGPIETAANLSKQNLDYCYAWANLTGQEFKKAINARQKGGLARYMQHLPIDPERIKAAIKQEFQKQYGSHIEQKQIDALLEQHMPPITDHELQNIKFKNKETRSKIATSNVKVAQTIINGVPAVVCWAEYDIKKREQIGFSYGNYWLDKKCEPRYFYLDATLIPKEEYTNATKYDENSTKALIDLSEDKNPLSLYKKGVVHYKKKDFTLAKFCIEKALELFKQKKGAEIECGNCYSTLASCNRELGDLNATAIACEEAILIFEDKQDQAKLSAVVKKYDSCFKIIIKEEKTGSTELYDNTLRLYHDKQYLLASYRLKFLIIHFDEKMNTRDQLATYHSALSSCLRELKGIDDAIKHCEEAVKLRVILYGKDHDLTKRAEKKLQELQTKKQPNQQGGLKN